MYSRMYVSMYTVQYIINHLRGCVGKAALLTHFLYQLAQLFLTFLIS